MLTVTVQDDLCRDSGRRGAVMVRLLDSCIQLLAEQGMTQLFMDAVKGGDEGFPSMGECDKAKNLQLSTAADQL